MKPSKNLLKVLITFIALAPIPLAFAGIDFNTQGVIYQASSGGIVFLDIPFSATSFSFSNGFLMFQNLRSDSGNWLSIGFSCQTETANMTINVVETNYLKYTVNAPSMTTSVTKIYYQNKVRPRSVTGAYSWKYDPLKKILTVSVFHNSPQQVEIEWGNQEEVMDRYLANLDYYDLLALVPFILVCGMVIGAIMRGTLDTGMVVWFIIISTVISICLFVMTKFYGFFI